MGFYFEQKYFNETFTFEKQKNKIKGSYRFSTLISKFSKKIYIKH